MQIKENNWKIDKLKREFVHISELAKLKMKQLHSFI
jgi:hypothetical protein